ncbi:hypothetical protein [Actinacidiphila yeochonensis]|uniref:hypothetical protein n=1 Tax=Actinacidiphila yeochonensis TaxID=89050 RepID=UPI00056B73B7|nr:hypothetical protein [Actinacidiphila yeochonensis]
MTQLPEDIIDRLADMDRRIRKLSTAVTIRRPITTIGGTAIRIKDQHGNTIISDAAAGGLGRPYLAMLPPQDVTYTRWPQTTSTVWTTIAQSQNVVWQPNLHLIVATYAPSGTTGQLQVLVGGVQVGQTATVTASGTFEYNGPVVDSEVFANQFGKQLTFEIKAQVTSGAGPVYAQTQLMHGIES